jgi:hypothetical protein
LHSSQIPWEKNTCVIYIHCKPSGVVTAWAYIIYMGTQLDNYIWATHLCGSSLPVSFHCGLQCILVNTSEIESSRDEEGPTTGGKEKEREGDRERRAEKKWKEGKRRVKKR